MMDRTVGQQIEGVNPAPEETPYDKQGARPTEKLSSKKERAAESSHGVRKFFSCITVNGISLFVTL